VFQAMMDGLTHRRRPATLTELANTAAFIAADEASAITGTVINLTSGAITDRG
jgi:enoyl-[acyl-carrier-protein] reductase (NADH)